MQDRGYIAILTILIVMAVALAVTTTVSLLSIGEAQSSLSLAKGEDTLQFVNGCMEDALLKAWASSKYNGGNIQRPEGECSISISKVGSTWTMDVSTTATLYKRSVRVVFTKSVTGLSLTSYREI